MSDSGSSRRGFLSRVVNWSVAAGLGGSGALGSGYVVKYLYPREGLVRKRRIYLAPLVDLPPGKARNYRLPSGESAVVTNTGDQVVALSDVCPHLGCKVRWDEAERGFLCPCHGGLFSKEGKALRGPPAEEGKDLRRYQVAALGEHVFIEVEEPIV